MTFPSTSGNDVNVNVNITATDRTASAVQSAADTQDAFFKRLDSLQKQADETVKRSETLNQRLSDSAKKAGASASGAYGDVGSALGNMSKQAQMATSAIGTLSTGVKILGLGLAGLLVRDVFGTLARGASALIGPAFQASSAYEKMSMTIGTLVAREEMRKNSSLDMTKALAQTEQKTKDLIYWNQKLAIDSPFGQAGVTGAFRMAQSYGFTATEAKRLTGNLINFAAGSGLGEDVMQRISMSLGQMKAMGRVTGMEMRELAFAGITVNDVAKAMGKTTAEFNRLKESGKLTVRDFTEALNKMMEHDFAGAAKRQATSLAGLASSMEDLSQLNLRSVFMPAFEAFRPAIAAIIDKMSSPEWVANMEKIGGILANAVLPAVEQIEKGINNFFTPENTNAMLGQVQRMLKGVQDFGATVGNVVNSAVHLGELVGTAVTGSPVGSMQTSAQTSGLALLKSGASLEAIAAKLPTNPADAARAELLNIGKQVYEGAKSGIMEGYNLAVKGVQGGITEVQKAAETDAVMKNLSFVATALDQQQKAQEGGAPARDYWLMGLVGGSVEERVKVFNTRLDDLTKNMPELANMIPHLTESASNFAEVASALNEWREGRLTPATAGGAPLTSLNIPGIGSITPDALKAYQQAFSGPSGIARPERDADPAERARYEAEIAEYNRRQVEWLQKYGMLSGSVLQQRIREDALAASQAAKEQAIADAKKKQNAYLADIADQQYRMNVLLDEQVGKENEVTTQRNLKATQALSRMAIQEMDQAEDKTRSHNKAIEKIDKDTSKAREKIIEDYNKRVADLQDDNSQEIEDAERARDAYALARIMRNKQDTVQGATEQKDEQLAELEKGKQEQLQALADSEKEQEELAAISRDRQLRDLKFSLTEMTTAEDVAYATRLLGATTFFDNLEATYKQRYTQIDVFWKDQFNTQRANLGLPGYGTAAGETGDLSSMWPSEAQIRANYDKGIFYDTATNSWYTESSHGRTYIPMGPDKNPAIPAGTGASTVPGSGGGAGGGGPMRMMAGGGYLGPNETAVVGERGPEMIRAGNQGLSVYPNQGGGGRGLRVRVELVGNDELRGVVRNVMVEEVFDLA